MTSWPQVVPEGRGDGKARADRGYCTTSNEGQGNSNSEAQFLNCFGSGTDADHAALDDCYPVASSSLDDDHPAYDKGAG